jgi:hypothetical protein
LLCAAGQLISRLTSDCYAITRCIATNVNVALRNLLQVIGMDAAQGTHSTVSTAQHSTVSKQGIRGLQLPVQQ